MKTISCIICAYNEAERIGALLLALKNHPLIHEVIVVDDGSSDETARVVSGFPFVRLIRHENNLGKSAAFLTGVRASSGDLILTLDADLIGITAADISNLVNPVLSGQSDAAISMRKNGYFNLSVLWGFDYISGERIFPKSLIQPYLPAIAKLPGYGIEVYLNRLIIEKRLRVTSVNWMHIKNPDKTEKRNLVDGVLGQLFMVSDILQVAPVHEVINQHIRLFVQTKKDT